EAYIDQLCTVSNKMLNPATPALVEDAVAGAALILSRQLPRQLWAEAVPQGAVNPSSLSTRLIDLVEKPTETVAELLALFAKEDFAAAGLFEGLRLQLERN